MYTYVCEFVKTCADSSTPPTRTHTLPFYRNSTHPYVRTYLAIITEVHLVIGDVDQKMPGRRGPPANLLDKGRGGGRRWRANDDSSAMGGGGRAKTKNRVKSDGRKLNFDCYFMGVQKYIHA